MLIDEWTGKRLALCKEAGWPCKECAFFVNAEQCSVWDVEADNDPEVPIRGWCKNFVGMNDETH